MPNETLRANSRLRLVHSKTANPIRSREFFQTEVGPQTSLFAYPKPGMIVFVQFQSIKDVDFVDLLTEAQPAYVVDLRLAPRFDIGVLNRRLVFELFDKVRANYVDSTAVLMSGKDRETAIKAISELLHSSRVDLERPIVFILENMNNSAASDSEILAMLADAGKNAREILVVPT
jgi:hypothetical protein